MTREEFVAAVQAYVDECEHEGNWHIMDDPVDLAIDFLLWVKNGGLE